MKKKPLYSIGALLTEIEDKNLNLVTGLITNILFNKDDEQFNYSIKWSDMITESIVNESILHWRVQNKIWRHYGVIK